MHYKSIVYVLGYVLMIIGVLMLLPVVTGLIYGEYFCTLIFLAVGAGSALRALTGPDVMDLPLLASGTVSVFSANDCARGVIETGMLYSLDDEDLSNRTSRGVSNELVGKPARIAVEEGTLYVFYPLP